MKHNPLKYIFIVVAIVLAVFAIYYFLKKDNENVVNNENQAEENIQEEAVNIRLGISNLDNLNPIISTNQNIQDISKLIYEPLFNITDEFKLENALGIEYSKVDGKTYMVKLREEVKWHNGETFKAEDIKFTIDKIKQIGDKSIYFANVSNIANVEIINDYLIKIYLTEEEIFFEYNLTFPIIQSKFYGEGDILTSDKNNVPMGTGKYKVDSVDIVSYIELKKNQNWWNEERENLKIDTITIRIYGTIAELYNAYKLGGIDLITSNSTNIEDTVGTIGSNVKLSYGRKFDYLALNTQKNGLSQKEVRQAINYAIDKDEIINTVYGGKYIKADYPLEYGSYLYDENREKQKKDIEKAKSILQNSGWEYKYGSWQKKIGYNTIRLKLNLVVQSSNEGRVKSAEIIKKNIEELRNTSYNNISKRSSFSKLFVK